MIKKHVLNNFSRYQALVLKEQFTGLQKARSILSSICFEQIMHSTQTICPLSQKSFQHVPVFGNADVPQAFYEMKFLTPSKLGQKTSCFKISTSAKKRAALNPALRRKSFQPLQGQHMKC